MLDPLLNLRIAGMEQRELLRETERISEARRSSTIKPRVALPYDLWMARLGDLLINLGMKLKTRPGTEGYGPELNIG